MPVSNWSTTAASNGATLGIDIAENCDAANVNNAMREMMAQLKTKIDAMDALITAGSLGAMLTALEALTTSANEMIYFTGADAPAMTTLSTFARTLLDDGDAATARGTLAALGKISVSFGANTLSISIWLDSSNTLLIQGGTGSLVGNTSTTLTFGTPYSVAPVCIVNGGGSDTDEGDIHNVGAASTTGVTIANGAPSTDSYTWLAIGKA